MLLDIILFLFPSWQFHSSFPQEKKFCPLKQQEAAELTALISASLDQCGASKH